MKVAIVYEAGREFSGPAVCDIDPAQAARSPRDFFNTAADTGTLLPPVHFPSPTPGRIGADGEGSQFHSF